MDTILKNTEEALREIDWEKYDENRWLGRPTIQPAIKFKLFEIGKKGSFWPVSEFYPEAGESKKRIDMAWFYDGDPLYAFEIDPTVATRSVAKLDMMPDYTNRVIISMSRNWETIAEHYQERLPENFHFLDVQRHDQEEEVRELPRSGNVTIEYR